MVKKEIRLTGRELAEFKTHGHTTHSIAGITYFIDSDAQGLPVVTSAQLLSVNYPAVNFDGMIECLRYGVPLYKGPIAKEEE